MKRLIKQRNLLTIAISLLNMSFLYGMNASTSLTSKNDENFLQQIQEATNHNHTNPLLLQPQEILNKIFFFCQKNKFEYPAFKKNIISFIRLSASCKKLNTVITVKMIGDFCKNIADLTKRQILDDFIIKKIRPLYQKGNYRVGEIPLMFAKGANIKITNSFLFQDTLLHDDIALITALLEQGVYPNKDYYINNPLFFYAQSAKAAELFINNGAYVHMKGEYATNVLFYVINYHCKSELIEFYLNHKVNPRELSRNNDSLLHALANHKTDHNSTDEFLKIAELIINAIPDMINHKNNVGQTPLDRAYVSLGAIHKWGEYQYRDATEQLIELFKKNGAVTATESAYWHYPCNLF